MRATYTTTEGQVICKTNYPDRNTRLKAVRMAIKNKYTSVIENVKEEGREDRAIPLTHWLENRLNQKGAAAAAPLQ